MLQLSLILLHPENYLNVSDFSKIANRENYLDINFRLLNFPHSSISTTGRALHNLPFEPAGLAGARRVDPLKVIESHILTILIVVPVR